MACSRPPPPTTRTLMVAVRRRRRPGFLVSRTPLNSESLRRLHEFEVVPLRVFECHDTHRRIIADLLDEVHPLSRSVFTSAQMSVVFTVKIARLGVGLPSVESSPTRDHPRSSRSSDRSLR